MRFPSYCRIEWKESKLPPDSASQIDRLISGESPFWRKIEPPRRRMSLSLNMLPGNGGLELNDSNLKAPASIFIIDDDGPDIPVSFPVDRTRSKNEGIMSEYAPAMG